MVINKSLELIKPSEMGERIQEGPLSSPLGFCAASLWVRVLGSFLLPVASPFVTERTVSSQLFPCWRAGEEA